MISLAAHQVPENEASYRALDIAAIPVEDVWYYASAVQTAMAESMGDLEAGNVEIYPTEQEFLDPLEN